MPKYYYHCNNCEDSFYVYHLMSENQTECTMCGLTEIEKLLTKPLYIKNNVQNQKTGEVTKKYIDDNKKLLDEMKKEATSKMYD
tara:strand:+ start:1006 stop:1257 length:252 start_codon:yes stop_codon:yes gene_type:complete